MGTNNKKEKSDKKDRLLKRAQLKLLQDVEGLSSLLSKNNINHKKILRRLHYEQELNALQIELVKMQRWIQDQEKRLVIIFEGRDAAGKGGAIKRFTEHLNLRSIRVVALPKPSDSEKGQWYFQRYVQHLPSPGEIVFFDRSWYNRAVVEPVNGFCTQEQYLRFMKQVPSFEHLLYDDGLIIIKFWFSVSKAEQKKRFASRKNNPLKQWKQSPVDARAQDLWDQYTYYRNEMFSKTHTPYSPWMIVRGDDKMTARLESIRYVLTQIPYEGKKAAEVSLHPEPEIVMRFHTAFEDFS